MRASLKFISAFLLLGGMLHFMACPNSCRPNKRVFFENLVDNQKVPEQFQIKFGSEGLQVKPAGVDIENKSAGHFHILVDNPNGYTPEGEVVPSDDKNIHYGKGQTETELSLSPGKHTLTLQFADGAHRSYGKNLATTVNVEVESTTAPVP